MRWLILVLLLTGCSYTANACRKQTAQVRALPREAAVEVSEPAPAGTAMLVEDWTQYPKPSAETYGPQVPAMNLRKPLKGESMLLLPTNPVVQVATKALGVSLDFAFPISSKAHHAILLIPHDLMWEADSSYPREYVLVQAQGGSTAYPESLYVGTADPGDIELSTTDGIKDLGLVIFRLTKSGDFQLLDSIPVPGSIWLKICLIDVDKDNQLDLVVSALAGDPGGAIRVFTIQIDGKLTAHEVFGSSWNASKGNQVSAEIPCAEGDLCLKDLNNDGCWEIIIRQWKEWASYSYWEVYRYDNKQHLWFESSKEFPAFLAEQTEFYQLYDAAYAKFFAERKATGKTIPELLGPEWKLLEWRGTPYVLDWRSAAANWQPDS